MIAGMPDFDDSFLSYCERKERKGKHSYNFNSARSSSGGGGTSSSSSQNGLDKQSRSTGGSRSNLLTTAKSYSKTLPRSFRKNLQKISQFIRDSDNDLHFYDLNHNEVATTAAQEAVVLVDGGGGRRGRRAGLDKVISIVDFHVTQPAEPVELLANRSLEEKCLEFGSSTASSDEGVVHDVEESDNEFLDGDVDVDGPGAATGEENNSKWRDGERD